MILLRKPASIFCLLAFVGLAWPGHPSAPAGPTNQETGQGGSRPKTHQPIAKSPRRDEPDDDEATLREAQVRRSIQENCLICHTEDVIAGQRLTPIQWKAEIDKMVNWGSPLPKEAELPLIDYLARRYSNRTAPTLAVRAPLRKVGSLELPGPGRTGTPINGDPEHGSRVYNANCATCHGQTGLGGDMGPSLAGKAILAHPREYDQILKQGLRRMPGFQTTMTNKDQADVLAWLQRQSYPPITGTPTR